MSREQGSHWIVESSEISVHLFLCHVCLLSRLYVVVDVTKAEADELPLTDGESYFVVVRATNKLGYVNTIHSDGVTVQVEPLLPGNVRDGDLVGKDLNYQQSITSISANWDAFGQSRGKKHRSVDIPVCKPYCHYASCRTV